MSSLKLNVGVVEFFPTGAVSRGGKTVYEAKVVIDGHSLFIKDYAPSDSATKSNASAQAVQAAVQPKVRKAKEAAVPAAASVQPAPSLDMNAVAKMIQETVAAAMALQAKKA